MIEVSGETWMEDGGWVGGVLTMLLIPIKWKSCKACSLQV